MTELITVSADDISESSSAAPTTAVEISTSISDDISLRALPSYMT